MFFLFNFQPKTFVNNSRWKWVITDSSTKGVKGSCRDCRLQTVMIRLNKANLLRGLSDIKNECLLYTLNCLQIRNPPYISTPSNTIGGDTLARCWIIVGLPSTTLAQHWSNIGSTYRVCWDCYPKCSICSRYEWAETAFWLCTAEYTYLYNTIRKVTTSVSRLEYTTMDALGQC